MSQSIVGRDARAEQRRWVSRLAGFEVFLGGWTPLSSKTKSVVKKTHDFRINCQEIGASLPTV